MYDSLLKNDKINDNEFYLVPDDTIGVPVPTEEEVQAGKFLSADMTWQNVNTETPDWTPDTSNKDLGTTGFIRGKTHGIIFSETSSIGSSFNVNEIINTTITPSELTDKNEKTICLTAKINSNSSLNITLDDTILYNITMGDNNYITKNNYKVNEILFIDNSLVLGNPLWILRGLTKSDDYNKPPFNAAFDNRYDFCLLIALNNNSILIFLDPAHYSAGQEYTFYIYSRLAEVIPLSERYIPDSIARIADLPAETALLPTVTEEDNGKFLRVVNGAWSVETIPSAEGVEF